MWRNKSHLLVPFTLLTGNTLFEWEETHQKAFDEIKEITSKETMLHDPNNELLHLIIPDTLGKHLRSHESHNKDKSIDFTNVEEVLKH